jgi:NADH-quinone oxidoreductase subunit D
MTSRLSVGVGAAALATADVVLDLGAHHPSTHGLLQLALTVDGDRIVTAEPVVGYMHRGAEKLFEVRDYRQAVVLANRHDWLSAFSNELGIVLAVERMMGIDVPERAGWLRTLLAELNRVLNSLMFLGSYPAELGAEDVTLGAHAGREALQAVMEEASGGRLHYMFNRVGGLRSDVPEGWTGRVRRALDDVRRGLEPVELLIGSSTRFAERTRGVGVLSCDTVAAYGMSGPVARASGYDMDLRRDDPYLAYAELGFGTAFPVVLGDAGDSYARYRCLLEQVHVSLDLAAACLPRLPGGPVDVRLPKTVRAPEGATYCWTENPLGAQGYYLVSRGATTPWRLAMRTASFNNVSALPALLPGLRVEDLVAVLGSLFFVIGDVDK